MKIIFIALFLFGSIVNANPGETTKLKEQKTEETVKTGNLRETVSGKEYLVKKLDYLNQIFSKNHKA